MDADSFRRLNSSGVTTRLSIQLELNSGQAISSRPFRQLTRQKFQGTKAHYPHSIFARHHLNSKKANTLWMLSCPARVVETTHRCSSTVSVEEKPSFLM